LVRFLLTHKVGAQQIPGAGKVTMMLSPWLIGTAVTGATKKMTVEMTAMRDAVANVRILLITMLLSPKFSV
jgi:hypothetical protein